MQPESTTVDTSDTFDCHAIVEMLGHRRVAGRIREVQLAGAGFLRLDIPATEGHAAQTQYISPGSVYALHPVDEATATAVAAHCRPAPVHRWELPAAPAKPADDADVNVSRCTCEPGYDGEDEDCPVHGDEDDTRDVEGGPF